MVQNKSTADAILDTAQRLIQTRGYNAFSYRDIAQALGIRSASIHYHFPTKTDLGARLAARYRRLFRAELDAIVEGEPDAVERLLKFADLFQQTFEVESRLCLCGMLSAEIATLPEGVAAEVEGFFRDTEAWLVAVLEEGRKAKRFSFSGPAKEQARLLLALLEGAMVVARGLRDRAHFRSMAGNYIAQMKPQTARAAR